MSNINLSVNVKRYRKEKSFTQQDLAIKANLPLSIIAKIEQGFSSQPTIQTVVKLAQALEVSLDELVLE